MDRPRPDLGEGMIAAAHDAGGTKRCEAMAVNSDQPKPVDGFDRREGPGRQKVQRDKLGAYRSQAGFGKGAFPRGREIANTIRLLRVVEAVASAHTKMQSIMIASMDAGEHRADQDFLDGKIAAIKIRRR